MAQKYSTYIGVGYLDKEGDDYYNRYMIAGLARHIEPVNEANSLCFRVVYLRKTVLALPVA